MYRHVARCHLGLAQLWRCPVSWCTVWKGAPQDLMDHVKDGPTRNAFPAMDGNTPGIHRIADVSTLRHLKRRAVVQRYRAVVGPSLPGAQEGPSPCSFRRNYMSQLRALLPLPMVLPIEGGLPDPTCSPLPCAVESPNVVCASPRPSRGAIGRWRPIRVMESPVRIAPRLTVQDPLAVTGAVVLGCRPPLLPGVMNVSGVDLAVIQSSTMASKADIVPPEREPSFGGGDLLTLICP